MESLQVLERSSAAGVESYRAVYSGVQRSEGVIMSGVGVDNAGWSVWSPYDSELFCVVLEWTVRSVEYR